MVQSSAAGKGSPPTPAPSWREARGVRLSAALIGVVLLYLYSAVASDPVVSAWERGAFDAVNGLGPAWWFVLFPVMQVGTLAAGPVAGLGALAARRRTLGIQLAGAGLAAYALARVVKALVGRPRPPMLLEDVITRGAESGGLGYPSGHVSVVMALATVLAPHLPKRWRWVPWLVVAAVAMARVYVGAHLPLDVIGGLLLGGLVGAGVRVLAGTRLRARRSARERVRP